MAKKVKKDEKKPRDLLFLACLFLGLGIGLVLGRAGTGVLIGIGVGFLAAFIYEAVFNKKK